MGLEEPRAADAAELAVRHDADAVAQDVGLVHVVRRQEYGPIFLRAGEQIPQLAARERVHAGRRLIQ